MLPTRRKRTVHKEIVSLLLRDNIRGVYYSYILFINLTVVDLGEGSRSTEESDESEDEELAALDITED